jgi:uncharacterized membrane protein
MTAVPTTNHHRDTGLDELRGLAVIGMVVAHAIYFFHTATNPFLQAIERTANTSLFTVFLFIAGAASYISLRDHHHRSSHQFKRLFVLYGSYAIVAVVGILTEPHTGGLWSIVLRIIYALTLTRPPSFTEYFIPLLFYSVFVMIIGKKWLDRITASVPIVAIFGIAAYMIGTILYTIDVPLWLQYMKAIFVGHERTLVFPIVQYLGVFLFGYFWKHSDTLGHTRSVSRYASVIAVGVITSASFVITNHYIVPILDPYNRWPPSIGFLAFGLTVASVGSLIYSEYQPDHSLFHRLSIYFGQDALDIWIVSTLLVYIYRLAGFPHFDSPVIVAILTLLLLCISAGIASFHGRHIHSLFARTFSIDTATHPSEIRVKKRYALLLSILIGINAWQLNEKQNRPTLGNYMEKQLVTTEQKLPDRATLALTSNRAWIVTDFTDSQPILLHITLTDESSRKRISLSQSTHLRITDNGTPISPSCDYSIDGSAMCTVLSSTLPIGIHTIISTVTSGFIVHTSAPVTITISAPLIISWSFDWEGWDASDYALETIDALSATYKIPFTHFVSPRTFLEGVLTPERRDQILAFLQKRHDLGDELALHLHMHSDFVAYAGVAPRHTNHWGYRSTEGYDIPTTEYSEDELSRIFAAAKSMFENVGLPTPIGYRAGGWFADERVLSIVSRFGILYDASGRDRPATGAFRTVPWNLSQNTQPYIPSVENQNAPGISPLPLLEIPNNGHSTFESTSEEFINRVKSIYTSGYLPKPIMLSFVSHPQFADAEFKKIPPVLEYLKTISATGDAGPAVFATEASIYHLWTSKQ